MILMNRSYHRCWARNVIGSLLLAVVIVILINPAVFVQLKNILLKQQVKKTVWLIRPMFFFKFQLIVS